MLKGLMKFIEKATTKTAAAAEARKARNAIRKNPKVTGDKEAAALSQINKKEQEVLAAIAKRTGNKKTSGTQRPISENRKEAAAGRLGRSGASDKADYEVELGKAGKFTAGRKAEPSFADMETSNRGRVNRNKKVADLETKETKGTITAEEKKQLDRLNAASKKQDVDRSRKAAQTRSAESRKDKGVSLAGEGGRKITVGSKPKYKDSELIGSNANGIVRETGEILGNPTPNQMQMAIRNLDARTSLSAEAKRNLAKLKGMSKSDRQDLTLRKMERKMRDTDRGIKGLNMSKGGMSTHKNYKDGGMANCGASMKPAQGSTKNMAYGGMATMKKKK